MNQVKSKLKSIREDRLRDVLKGLNLTEKEVEAQWALLFPGGGSKRLDLSPLTKEELALLENASKLKNSKEIAKLLNVEVYKWRYRYATLAFRYFVNNPLSLVKKK